MIEFFINRYMEKIDGLFYFSFLAKSNSQCDELSILLYNEFFTEKYTHKFKTTEPEIIYVCVPNTDTKKRYYYNVVYNYINVYQGHFTFLHPDKSDEVKFCFVSCNDNVAESDWNTYHERGVSNKIWKNIMSQGADILIHNGDNIYNDSTFLEYKKTNELELVKTRMSQLFIETYSDEYQGQCMRQCWNFHLIDDHDITDCFGTPNTDVVCTNHHVYRFYFVAKDILNKYLVTHKCIDNRLFCYNFDINKKYKLIFLDTRLAMYHYDIAYHPLVIDFCKSSMDSSKTNLILTPRPLFQMSYYPASLIGTFVPDARDGTWHSMQYEHSKEFYNMLFEFAKNANIYVISGDIHETYIQTHKKGDIEFQELVTSGVTRSSQIRQPWYVKSGLKTIRMYEFIRNSIRKLIGKSHVCNIHSRSLYNNYGELVNGTLINYTYKE